MLTRARACSSPQALRSSPQALREGGVRPLRPGRRRLGLHTYVPLVFAFLSVRPPLTRPAYPPSRTRTAAAPSRGRTACCRSSPSPPGPTGCPPCRRPTSSSARPTGTSRGSGRASSSRSPRGAPGSPRASRAAHHHAELAAHGAAKHCGSWGNIAADLNRHWASRARAHAGHALPPKHFGKGAFLGYAPRRRVRSTRRHPTGRRSVRDLSM